VSGAALTVDPLYDLDQARHKAATGRAGGELPRNRFERASLHG
jgi:hypothetical protein